MADHIHIENLSPYDGDWPLDVGTLTNRELHLIKQISGVRANELEEAFNAADNDLVVAFAEIALTRAGLRVNRDRLWDAPIGAIRLVLGDEEEQEDADNPPASAPPNEPDSKHETDSGKRSSGSRSTNGGDPQAKSPSPTGTPASATSATYTSRTSRT